MTKRLAMKILKRYLGTQESKMFIESYPECLELDSEDLDNFVLDIINDETPAGQHWNESKRNLLFWNG